MAAETFHQRAVNNDIDLNEFEKNLALDNNFVSGKPDVV